MYVFLDIHRHYSPVTTRLIRDAARAVRSTRKSVLFLSPFFQAPEELRKEIALAVFQLPDAALLGRALDDFGAGHSGLGLLTQIKPDIVKLDMQLIWGIDRHAARQAIMKHTLAMLAEYPNVLYEPAYPSDRKSVV